MLKDLKEHLGEPEVVGKALRLEGKRMTKQRVQLLRIIADNEKHLDAEEIYRQARAQGTRVTLATVYRTLRMLVEMRLLNELHFDEQHHHYEQAAGEHCHLICLECGCISEFWPPDGGDRLRQVAQESGFELVEARVELHGYCKQCRARREDTVSAS